MSKFTKERFTFPTSLGEAEGVEQENYGVGDRTWLLSHPWGGAVYCGTVAQAKAELKRIVALFDADNDDDRALEDLS